MKSKDKDIKVSAGHITGPTGLYNSQFITEEEVERTKVWNWLKSGVHPFHNLIWALIIVNKIKINNNNEIVWIRQSAVKKIIKEFWFKGIKLLIKQMGLIDLWKIYFYENKDKEA